ncbi:MAG: adenylate/guanylate cyclase domain-containing protein [bacterium]
MSLRVKLSLYFLAVLLGFLPLLHEGIEGILEQETKTGIETQSRFFVQLLSNEIEHLTSEAANYQELIDRIQKFITIAKASSKREYGFIVDEIVVVNLEFKVVAGAPAEEVGHIYSSHEDIVAAASKGNISAALESHGEDLNAANKPPHTHNDSSESKVTYDVTQRIDLRQWGMHVLEVQMDFEATEALQKAVTNKLEYKALVIAGGFLILLLGLLLASVTVSAIRPLKKLKHAMELVEKGDLTTSLTHKPKDEFGDIFRAFNAMVHGLQERFQLTKYVSRATQNAVKLSVQSRDASHTAKRVELTIFFSDIRGFTTYSERHSPETVIALLNRILTLQAEVIHENRGDVDKFIGDGTMAVFDSEVSAIKAALEIQRLMRDLSSEISGLKLGIGIYKGQVVQGDVGASHVRDFTVIGDAVNTAARLQGIAQAGEILIAEEMAKTPEVAAQFTVEFKGEVQLKGKLNPLLICCVKDDTSIV